MNILAIESSCDETAAAVVTDGVRVVSNSIASSHDMHEKYGGVVPELAARAQMESIIPVIRQALTVYTGGNTLSLTEAIRTHIDAIAVTVGPGLIGSLLVGVESARALAYATQKPIIPVNHVLAHMYANFVHAYEQKQEITFPAISLVVSGGHTELYHMRSPTDLLWLGGTLDDAAGECFDKTARLLGFGHGGGVAIQEAAKKHDSHRVTGISLPRPMLDKNNALNFSFSGLKTAILRETERLKSENNWNDTALYALSHEVQETITDVLVKKTLRAIDTHEATSVLLSGGVSANLRLRQKLAHALAPYTIPLFVPPISLCTDNAVYIASYAYFRGKKRAWQDIDAYPSLPVEVEPTKEAI